MRICTLKYCQLEIISAPNANRYEKMKFLGTKSLYYISYAILVILGMLVGWLFRLSGPLRQYFSLYRAVSQREGGGRMVRWCWVNFQCLGVLLIWTIVGQGLTALAVGAGGGC